jgi:sulfur-oxidizing protein SoxY
MQPQMDSSVVDRRAFVLGASAAAAIAPFLAAQASPQVVAEEGGQGWEEALKRIVGDAQPIANGRLTFDLPETAENGNMVPFTIAVDSPMTENDYVKALYVLATANPSASVATFRFTPLSGRASAASRLRLARSQDVIGVAELGDRKFLMTRRPVKVTIGGCGG